MTLSDHLLLALVDKGLLAVVLIVFGLWANRALEHYKGRQHLLAEVAKERVQRIDPLLDFQSLDTSAFEKAMKDLDKSREEVTTLLQKL